MAHPLGDPVLLVPDTYAPAAAQVADLAAALRRRDVASRTVRLGRDPRRTVAALVDDGERFLVHCGGQPPMVRWLPEAVGNDVVVGVFPGGVANDFAKTFGLEVNAEAASILLAGPRFVRVDVGVVRTATAERFVFNAAVVGLGAGLRGRGPAQLARWYRAIAAWRPTTFDVDMTFAEWHGPATQVRLSNGQWAYDGLYAAPTALPDDGAWDVQVWAGPKTLPFTTLTPMVRGEHLPSEHITQWRQKRAEVVASPPAKVAADDVVVGRTPASFELRPKALRLKV